MPYKLKEKILKFQKVETYQRTPTIYRTICSSLLPYSVLNFLSSLFFHNYQENPTDRSSTVEVFTILKNGSGITSLDFISWNLEYQQSIQ